MMVLTLIIIDVYIYHMHMHFTAECMLVVLNILLLHTAFIHSY